MTWYLALIAYAPVWLVRCVPRAWRRRSLRRWIERHLS